MEERKIKLYSRYNDEVALHVIPGHFATSHSHINYYIDITSVKVRAKEAEAAAKILVSAYPVNSMIVDTIVCMDGTEMVGAYMADEFQDRGFMISNQHDSIYVLRPEFAADNQMIFRETLTPYIWNKHVILLLSSTTTGLTVGHCIDYIKYYSGILEGVSTIFSIIDEVDGYKINSVFDREDVPNYEVYKVGHCPLCANGQRVEAMVNGFGYSTL